MRMMSFYPQVNFFRTFGGGILFPEGFPQFFFPYVKNLPFLKEFSHPLLMMQHYVRNWADASSSSMSAPAAIQAFLKGGAE